MEKVIIFDGIDGCGSSSVIKHFEERLNEYVIKNDGYIRLYSKNDITILFSEEPSGGIYGNMIREILKRDYIDQKELLLLFLLDRIDLYKKIREINPKLVILDRSFPSTLAYQGTIFNPEFLMKLHRDLGILSLLKADFVVIYLDVDPGIAMERITKRGKDLEVFEKMDFLKKVRDNYIYSIKIMEDYGIKVYKIDANPPLEEVIKSTEKILKKELPLNLFW